LSVGDGKNGVHTDALLDEPFTDLICLSVRESGHGEGAGCSGALEAFVDIGKVIQSVSVEDDAVLEDDSGQAEGLLNVYGEVGHGMDPILNGETSMRWFAESEPL
jgi:hypothetical protein